MARAAHTVTRQRYFERWTYDARILASAFAVVAPTAALLGIVLLWRELPAGLLVALACVAALLTLWFAVRLRNRVIYPLYTLSNLLEALREGDFSLRGSRSRRDDPIGEVIWEINTLSHTLPHPRHKLQQPSPPPTPAISPT